MIDLSIIIPTYNRKNTLKKSLDIIINEIRPVKNNVELIVIDNNSEDNSFTLINEFKKQNNDINFIIYKQDYNKGFIGNIKKGLELSKGEFLWLLSDDDFPVEGTLEYIIQLITKDIFCIYLGNNSNNPEFSYNIIAKEILLKKYMHALTKISILIFKNHSSLSHIFDKFPNNDFIGFLLFLESFKHAKEDKCIEFKQNHLDQNYERSKFDFFKTWGRDMNECVAFMSTMIHDKDLIENFKIKYINGPLKYHYLNFRLGQYPHLDYKKLEAEKLLNKVYAKNQAFVNEVEPYFSKSNTYIKVIYSFKKLKNKLKNIKNKLWNGNSQNNHYNH